jgi:hypothetical protein
MAKPIALRRATTAIALLTLSLGCGGDALIKPNPTFVAIGPIDGPVAEVLRAEYSLTTAAALGSGDGQVVVLDGDHTSAAAIRAMGDLKGAVEGGKAVIVLDAQPDHEQALSDVVEFPVVDTGDAHAYGVAKSEDQYLQVILPKQETTVSTQRVEYAENRYTFGPVANDTDLPEVSIKSIKALLRDVASRRSFGDPFVPPPKGVRYFFNVTGIYETNPAHELLDGQELEKEGYRIDLGVLSEDSPGVFRQYLMNVFDLTFSNGLLSQVIPQGGDPFTVGWMQSMQSFEGSFHAKTDKQEAVNALAQSNLLSATQPESSVATIEAGYRDKAGVLQQWKFDTGGWTNNDGWKIVSTAGSGVMIKGYQTRPYDAELKNYADFWLNGHMRPKLPASVWSTHFFLAPTFRFDTPLKGKVSMVWTFSRAYDRVSINRQTGSVTGDHIVIDTSSRPTYYNFNTIYPR